MIIGLLPIALASGAASEWKNGIAWVLIGGLTSSMLLTLVIVPVVFSVAENIKTRVYILFSSFLKEDKELNSSSPNVICSS
jgi:HAE1 family hydrophobic/amphiphilic exporter-1